MGLHQSLLFIRHLLHCHRLEWLCKELAHADWTLIVPFVLVITDLRLGYRSEFVNRCWPCLLFLFLLFCGRLLHLATVREPSHGQDVHFEFKRRHDFPSRELAKLRLGALTAREDSASKDDTVALIGKSPLVQRVYSLLKRRRFCLLFLRHVFLDRFDLFVCH